MREIFFFFLVANVRVKENRHGQIYDMGKSYPQVIRENVLDLHNNGLSIRQISAQARVSTGFITKVIKEYNENNYSVPRRALSGCTESVLTENVRSYLEVEKLCKPSSYSDELQWKFVGWCLFARRNTVKFNIYLKKKFNIYGMIETRQSLSRRSNCSFLEGIRKHLPRSQHVRRHVALS